MPRAAPGLWNESEILDVDTISKNFETPLVFTVAQVERNSFLRFRKAPTLNAAKEVGSILCKLTLDNRHVNSHFLNLSEDYITDVLPFNRKRNGLLNLCLDRRLFFAFSRRAAIALTPNLQDIPSCFVVPSMLNLCEILRARWHLGSIVSAQLDRAIDEIVRQVNEKMDSPTEPLLLLQNVVRWRILAIAFLRDPVPFLFDGGSITEIAEIAERLLWIDRLRDETGRKFELLDQLVRDCLNLDRQKRIERQFSPALPRKTTR